MQGVFFIKKLPKTITDPTILSTAKVQTFVKGWAERWKLICKLDLMLPNSGRIRDAFEYYVFRRPWARWHRFAYIPEYRDIFFDYVLRFFYQYPISKGHTVLQIGASFGEETIRFARAVGAQGLVIAVEPVPSNVERLRKTFTKEAFPQVAIAAKAAAGEIGNLRFFLGFEKEGRLADIAADNLTYDWWGIEDHLNEARYKGVIQVPADTPDNIIAPYKLDRIDFILIETNGTELEVVKAMDKTLRITKRIGARGHVKRDGIPIFEGISVHLKERGFEVMVTDEGMVLAENKSLP